MDKKKNIRLNQSSAKGSITERKSQDASIGKQWPRNSRRRDSKSNPQSSNDSPRNKSQPKSNFDKRASNNFRGNGYQRSVSSLSASSPSSRLDDAGKREPELNSLYLPGSKKHNMVHLINFSYPPREATSIHISQRTGYHRYHGRRNKYNKEQFLQATCQFVIRSEIDDSILLSHSVSADHLIDWTFIEQVNVRSSEEPQCPICLFHPVAGKMTRCGHIYCWSCILRYLSLTDKTWRKCPICYEAVHASDLKSSISQPHRNYNVGDVVTLQLMCREKNSLKVNKFGKITSEGFPHIFGDDDEVLHSKLLLADPNEIMTIIEREKKELELQLSRVENEPESDKDELKSVQKALTLLKERERTTLALIKKVDPKASPAVTAELKFDELSIDAEPLVPAAVNKVTQELIVESTLPVDKIEEGSELTVQDIDIASEFNDSKYFYFYQPRDGQPLYLHSINIRMLQMMYQSLDRAPHTISGRIVQKEVCSMTEELRNRLKYLQHLPVTSEFDVAELSFGSELLSEEVIDAFKDELLKRKKRRQRRARDENRREIKINEVNERQIGKVFARSANIDVNSDRQFPSCGASQSLFNDRDDPPLSLLASSGEIASSPSTSGLSFATMLSQSKKVESWPPLSPTMNPCWDGIEGAKKHTSFQPSSPIADSYIFDEDDSDEDGAGAPEFKSDFGTAIAVALEKQMFNQSDVRSGDVKTKKKKRQTVLFSTGLPGRSFKGN